MDPSREILSSASYALQQVGLPKPSHDMLKPFLSNPLLRCFEDNFNLTREKADQAFHYFWHYSGSFGLKKNRCYKGIPELLRSLHDNGNTLHIATAREISHVETFLKIKDLHQLFSVIVGPSNDPCNQRQTKKMILFDTLCQIIEEGYGNCVPDNCVMIGDRESDITAAHDNCISSIGVTYGQDPPEKIKEAQPTHVVATTAALAELLMKGTP